MGLAGFKRRKILKDLLGGITVPVKKGTDGSLALVREGVAKFLLF